MGGQFLLLQIDQFSACIQVATVDDPASARLGESLYHFVPRSVAGNWKDATAIERARLHARHHSPLSVHNRQQLTPVCICCCTPASHPIKKQSHCQFRSL